MHYREKIYGVILTVIGWVGGNVYVPNCIRGYCIEKILDLNPVIL